MKTKRILCLMNLPISLFGSFVIIPVRRPSMDMPDTTLSSEPPAIFSKVSEYEILSLPDGESLSITSPIPSASNSLSVLNFIILSSAKIFSTYILHFARTKVK